MAFDSSIPLPDAVPDAAADDPDLPGPFAVGRWAAQFRDFLRQRPRVLLIGEVVNLKRARVATYFELRDAEGAAPVAIWNTDLDRLALPEGALRDGAEVVLAGGPDYYPGSATASPGFNFRATYLRLAGEGDLLAQLDRARRRLDADGLLRPQKKLARPLLPKTIGVVSARGSAAWADLLAGLERRGWRGTLVWASAPVQDRRAAPAIARALTDLAAVPEVEVAVVCRGGGSLTDLWAFCDESLCRTVALLRLPVISAIGHQSDRTLIDDVAAVCCSTPTHAAEALVRVDVGAARAELGARGATTSRLAGATISLRAQRLAECSRTPTRALRSEGARLHQLLREIRAGAGRGVAGRRELALTHATVVARKGGAFAAADAAARRQLTTAERAVNAHDPQRTLERGYALVADRAGEPVASAAAARERERLVIRFADDAVGAEVNADGSDERPR
jgi:exodeoxyribonuclease VII large subunit